MNIKLHARLAAYSRVAGIESTIPTPSPEDAGKLLGVTESGEYTLVGDVDNNKIDALFETKASSKTHKTLIDSLFEEE